MNVVSKVMAFLMLILSIVYCGTSIVLFTHRTDWRGKYEKISAEYKKDKTALTAEVTQLKDKVSMQNDAIEAAKTSLLNMENDFKEKRSELSEANKNIARLEAAIAAKDSKIDEKDRIIERKDEAVTTLRAKSDELKAAAEKAHAEKVSAEEKLAEAESQLESTSKKLEESLASLAEVKKELELKEGMLSQLRESGIPVEEIAVSGGPATPIRAQVLAVRADANLVMLSVGSDNEVKEGYRFTIYRDSQYLGKVEVEKIFPDMCSARILKEFTEKQIKEGDSASTRVY